MGKLRILELENFKSYCGKQTVGPFDDFTCIIGPNGAGKSNMMDAISFVLGVQSRHLRSSHLKELIFRKDASSAPAKRASVKLVYVVSKDEIDGYAEGSEINFTRIVSSAGISNYRIDNKEVSYEKYESVLEKIGVLVKARNFLVFQGDVVSVASKSPMELTKLIEQISGSDQEKAEYDELLARKHGTEENTIFMMQKKKMFAAQRKEVKEQKEEAESFQEKQEELSDLKTEHVLWQLWMLKRELEEQDGTGANYREAIQGMREEERSLEDEITSAKKILGKANKSFVNCEKDVSVKKKNWMMVGPQLDEARAKIKSMTKKIADLGRIEANIEKDRLAQVANIASLESETLNAQQQETVLKAEIENLNKGEVTLDETKIAEYSHLREELAGRTAIQSAELDTATKELQSKEKQVAHLETQKTMVIQELQGVNNQTTEYKERFNKLSSGITNSMSEMAALQKQRNDSIENMNQSNLKLKDLEARLGAVSLRLQEIGDDRRRNRQETKMSDAIDAMKRVFPGVHGKLLDLCKPKFKKDSQAITVTAGRQMDAVVVESRAVATECIRYLKDQRIGTCIFLPLDNLKVKPVPEKLGNFGSKYRLCIDLVDYDEKFKPAVAYALGATLVCDTLEDARALCFGADESVKVVTTKGHVISKSGAMTGGRTQSDTHDRWEANEANKLQEEKSELEQSIAECKRTAVTRQQIVDIETAIKSVQTRIQFSEADKKVVSERIHQLEQQKTLKESSYNMIETDLITLRASLTTLQVKSAELHQVLREAEVDVFGAFSRSVGVENIREYEENQLILHQSLMKRRADCSHRAAALKAQLEYEMKRDFVGPLAKYQGQIKDAKSELANLEHKVKTLVVEEENAQKAFDKAKYKLSEATAEKNEATSSIRVLQSRQNEAVRKREVVEKKLSGVEILMERGRAQLHEVLQKAQVEEISLPAIHGPVTSQSSNIEAELRWGGSLSQSSSRFGKKGKSKAGSSDEEEDGSESADSTGMSSGLETGGSDSKSSRATSSIHFSQPDNPAVARDQRKVARVDLSSMKQYEKYTKAQMVERENELAEDISKLASELEDLQPNMHAVERYDGIVDKLKESSNELEAMKESARQDALAFDRVKKRRQKLFNDCFNQVSQALGVIYKDLTCSKRHPLGGNAYLTLEMTDEPYLGGIRFTAMPPMKRFRDMEQLSGGEKTMAALALLFSIHSYREAPFFVLDEVDAALDNVNVKKICNYIRQRSVEFQCIVISLKDIFFEQADSLVGICKDVETLSSMVLTLDLKKYTATDNESDNQLSSVPIHSPTTSHSSASKVSTGSRSIGSSNRSISNSGSNTLIGKRKSDAAADEILSGAWVASKSSTRRREIQKARVSSIVPEAILEEENEEESSSESENDDEDA